MKILLKSNSQLLLFLFFFFFTFFPKQVGAQTPSNGFSYPVTITEGVTCNDRVSCKKLCDDEVYKQACKKFKPTQKNLSSVFSNPDVVSDIQSTLSCTTQESCKAVCSQKENALKCHDIAQKYNLKGGYDPKVLALGLATAAMNISTPSAQVQAQIEELRQQVTQKLGIPAQNLKFFCQVPENQDQCTQLAQELGLKGGRKLEGPGGCESASSCRAYCDVPEHLEECLRYDISGPRECRTLNTCQQVVSEDERLLKKATELRKRVQNLAEEEYEKSSIASPSINAKPPIKEPEIKRQEQRVGPTQVPARDLSPYKQPDPLPQKPSSFNQNRVPEYKREVQNTQTKPTEAPRITVGPDLNTTQQTQSSNTVVPDTAQGTDVRVQGSSIEETFWGRIVRTVSDFF